jgi:hypothetical protein
VCSQEDVSNQANMWRRDDWWGAPTVLKKKSNSFYIQQHRGRGGGNGQRQPERWTLCSKEWSLGNSNKKSEEEKIIIQYEVVYQIVSARHFVDVWFERKVVCRKHRSLSLRDWNFKATI